MWRDRDTGNTPHDEEGRNWVMLLQAKECPRLMAKHHKLRERHGTVSLTAHRRDRHLDLRHLDLPNREARSSSFWSQPGHGSLLWHSEETNERSFLAGNLVTLPGFSLPGRKALRVILRLCNLSGKALRTYISPSVLYISIGERERE